MTLVESFRRKQQLDRLAREVEARLRLPAGQKSLNKDAMRRLLGYTRFEPARVRDLEIYVRPVEGEINEVVVLDNELPIYRTTVADVGLRKTPLVKEMLSIRNIRKILDDKDVVASKGEESLRRIYAQAFSGLDFSYSDDEIESLVDEGKQALKANSLERVEDILEVFLELLGYRLIELGMLEPHFRTYAVPVTGRAGPPKFRDIIFFDREELELVLVKGGFSPGQEADLERLLASLKGKTMDAEGEEVLNYLGRLARSIDPVERGIAIQGVYPLEEQVLEEVE
jgi:hypothetical protein